MNILVVDDESIIRDGIERTIQRNFPEHCVYQASSPEAAVELLTEISFSLVLTDVLMPGMTGLELMEISRKRHEQTKWVVISAYSEFAYAKEALRLGAKDYLLKPIGKETLVSKIEELTQEIAREQEQSHERSSEKRMLARNLHFLREGLLARLAAGLDLTGIDLSPITEQHPSFYLIMVRLESDQGMRLEHFIVSNVLNELIDRCGHGFVTSMDMRSLLGLVTFHVQEGPHGLVEQLRTHLKRYLKIPFQVLCSACIQNIAEVPQQVQQLHKSAASQVYDHYATGGEQAIKVALQYMHSNFAAELSLEKVASIIYLNPVYFSQLFKQKTGKGFKTYITDFRLGRAMKMLKESELKIGDIAERVGYPDVRHFSQIFRKKAGMTPSDYRLQHGQISEELDSSQA